MITNKEKNQSSVNRYNTSTPKLLHQKKLIVRAPFIVQKKGPQTKPFFSSNNTKITLYNFQFFHFIQ